MSKLSLKTLKRKKLPYGRFTYMVLLKRDSHHLWHCSSNASDIEDMRGMLRTTCRGQFKLIHSENRSKRRVYTHLYLTEAMDLAMLKLVHQDKLHKIYRIKVDQKPE